ncbi:MAG: hypothetical protein Q8Q32_02395 [bacterium]|nr:hypothetical protein [bacterium]
MKKYLLDFGLGALLNAILIFTATGQSLTEYATSISPTREITYLITSSLIATVLGILISGVVHRKFSQRAALSATIGSLVVAVFAYWILSQLF